MEDQNQANDQATIENHQITIEEGTNAPSTGQRPLPSRRSGGPRTAEGRRRSSQNACKHGLYTDEGFLEGAALELGEDPRQFQRLLKGLIAARRPVGALELAVVEDIALLLLKKARLDKAELAVQVCNLHQHDLERRKQMIQVGHNDSDATEYDVREHGLRRALQSPGQYEQVLTLLGSLLAMIDINEFGHRMREAMRTLYGTEHTLRGAELDTLRYKLSRTTPQDETFEPAKKAMMALVAEEMAAVGRQYELFLREHVESTRAARMAATAPSHAQWAAIIRQQNSLQRQMERKIRLLMELQRERRELDAAPFGGAPENPGRKDPSACYPSERRRGRACPTPDGARSLQAGDGKPFPYDRRPLPQAGQEPGADMPEGGTSAPPMPYAENTQKRGNELEDLLQTRGINENTPAKRTAFGAPNEAIITPAARQSPEKAALPPDLRKPSEPVKEFAMSHPEHSEGPSVTLTPTWVFNARGFQVPQPPRDILLIGGTMPAPMAPWDLSPGEK
jgi:hypothetical protein